MSKALPLIASNPQPITVTVYGKATGTKAGGKIWAIGTTDAGEVFNVYGPENPVPNAGSFEFRQSAVRTSGNTDPGEIQRGKVREGYSELGTYQLSVQNGKVVGRRSDLVAKNSAPQPQSAKPQGGLPKELEVAESLDWFF